MPSRPRILNPGAIVAGRFEILTVIDAGGMAVVYRAEDSHQSKLNRVVALKILNDSLARDPGRVARFEREARDAARLRHDHIVPVFDYGDEDGVFWIAMKLIAGETTLGSRLSDRTFPMSPREALATLRPIADALDYAHSREKLIHRDVKPENILVEEGTGRPFLADFGIAKGESHTTHTQVGEMIGTARYTSPEQIVGDPTTAATDIYSLAVVAYQALTGAMGPYAGASVGVRAMYAHLHDAPTPLGGEDPVTVAVYDVLAQGLAKNPADRPATATALIDAIAAAIGDRPEVLDRRPGFEQQPLDEDPEDLAPVEATVLLGAEIPDDTTELPALLVDVDADQPVGATEQLEQLLNEPPVIDLQPEAPRPIRSTADLRPRPRSAKPARERRPRTRRRVPRPTRNPAIVAAAIALPLFALAVTDPVPKTPVMLRAASAGSAELQLPAAARATAAAPVFKSAGFPMPTTAAATAANQGNQSVAIASTNKGTTAMAPASARGRADTIRLSGGTARRYRTAGGTVAVASTPTTVVWIACRSDAAPGPCAAATSTLHLSDATLTADPLPAVATSLRRALAGPRKARSELQLPVADLTRRKARASAIADAYTRAAAAVAETADSRPRDRDLRGLRGALQQTAAAYKAIAAASRRTGRGADSRARAQLHAADLNLRSALHQLQRRGYSIELP